MNDEVVDLYVVFKNLIMQRFDPIRNLLFKTNTMKTYKSFFLLLIVLSSCQSEETIAPQDYTEYITINGVRYEDSDFQSKLSGTNLCRVEINDWIMQITHIKGNLNENQQYPVSTYCENENTVSIGSTINTRGTCNMNRHRHRVGVNGNQEGVYTLKKKGEHWMSEFDNILLECIESGCSRTSRVSGRLIWDSEQ